MTHADLAYWLLDKETSLEVDQPGLSAAAERVCRKLSGRLSRSISPAGSQAILSRALHLARADSPFLEGVRAGRPPEACLAELGEHVQGIDIIDVRKGLLGVLATVLDLLGRFIGEDLMLRLVREVWPDLPASDSDPSGNADPTLPA